MKHIITIMASVAVLAGCVNTSSVMRTGPNTWDVSATADGMRPASDARQAAIEAANKHCASLGKVIQVTGDRSERTRMDIDTTYTVSFQCVNKNADDKSEK